MLYTSPLGKGEMKKNENETLILNKKSFKIWEEVSAYLSAETKKMGVDSCYFPMFVSEQALATEGIQTVFF